jgi:putative transposase
MRTPRDPIYAGHRYPAEIISYAVWLYFRFPLSLRMVEEMLAARAISVTHETIRQWGLKFGREFANRIRRRAPRRGDKWHLDEVVVSVAGKKHWLWRAVGTASFSMFSSRAGATRRLPNACSASSSGSRVEHLVCSSPTS